MTRRRSFPLGLDDVVPERSVKVSDDVRRATRSSASTNPRLTAALDAARKAGRAVTPGKADLTAQAAKMPQAVAKPAQVKATVPISGLGLDSQRARLALVRKLATAGMSDVLVLDALANVPRHLFVDSGLASQAYEDAALPIGMQQTISKPSVIARMIELLRHGMPAEQKLGRVLEIGTGCGYQAAVLAHVANEVYSIERIRVLHDKARVNLRALRLPNLRLTYGDGLRGLPQAAPFDAIIMAAAGLEVPEALLEQLGIGARLIAPVALPDGRQQLRLIVRNGRAQYKRFELESVHFVPLKSGTI